MSTPLVGSRPPRLLTFLSMFLIASLSYLRAQESLGNRLTDLHWHAFRCICHTIEIVAGDRLIALVDGRSILFAPPVSISARTVWIESDGLVVGLISNGSLDPLSAAEIRATIPGVATRNPGSCSRRTVRLLIDRPGSTVYERWAVIWLCSSVITGWPTKSFVKVNSTAALVVSAKLARISREPGSVDSALTRGTSTL